MVSARGCRHFGNAGRANVSPPRETDGGFCFGAARHTRSGNLSPTCQPVQIAELAKKETYNDLPNNAQKHLYRCGCFTDMCTSYRAGRESNAGAQLERTDWAAVCRVLRTFILSLARLWLESASDAWQLAGAISDARGNARERIAHAVLPRFKPRIIASKMRNHIRRAACCRSGFWPIIINQTSTTSKLASARPRRSIDQSPASRPKSRCTIVLRAIMLLSQFSSKIICPLF